MKTITSSILKTLRESIPIFEEDKIPKGFADTIDLMFMDGPLIIDRERLNILLSYWHLPPMNQIFFDHYFKGNIVNIEQFKAGINDFIVDALWHFGDLERAYLELSELPSVEDFLHKHRFDPKEFSDRLPWNLVEEIKPEDRGYLGYVSGQRPMKQKALLTFAEHVIREIEENKASYKNLSTPETTERVLTKLSIAYPEIRTKVEEMKELSQLKELDLFSSLNLDKSKEAVAKYRDEIEATILKIEGLKKIGFRNQEHYLRNIESLDVYVATSMRNDEEYNDMHRFVTEVFNDPEVKALNIRHFDPTLCYCESRIDKGIIECLLVRSTKVTIYCAQEGDTFGKDSELAATLAQGKPVIVYVPVVKETDAEYSALPEEERKTAVSLKNSKLDARAATFKDYHPLGLQVGLYDGVARGVIVVRSASECARILKKVLTNSLEVEIKYEQHGIVLREKETRSVIRVMTGWLTLASCFWNQFSKTQNPKSGLPD